MKKIHSIRTDYVKREMRIKDLEDSPAQQLSIWINEAIKSNVPDANAFCLSTVTSDGFPKGRMVLVRAIEGESVDFYTNKNSHKGKDFRSNAKAGATFFWAEMERQVCLTGVVTEISEEENDLYFDTRPRESQLSAWVSDQSSPIDSRDHLTKSYAEVKSRFDGVEKVFAVLMVFTACAMAFAHGSNDVANAVGPLAAIASVVQSGGEIAVKSSMPWWILLLGATGIVAGLATLGYKVIETVGRNITELTPSRGFAAELAAATTVVLASGTGLPISTTHTLVGAVLGVGLARGLSAVDFSVVGRIIVSWVVTLPVGAGLSIIFFFTLKGIFA